MKRIVDEENKVIEFWLTKAERDDPVLQEQLKATFSEYKEKKYLVAVFQSGDKDLHGQSLSLLRYNRKWKASQEVRQQQAACY